MQSNRATDLTQGKARTPAGSVPRDRLLRSAACAAVALASLAGAACRPETSNPPAPVATVRIDAAESEVDERLRRRLVEQRDQIVGIVLRGASGVDSSLLAAAAACPNLKSLDLGYSDVVVSDLSMLVDAEQLETLHLVGTSLTDAAAPAIARLAALKNLNIGETAITDQTLVALAGSPHLATLHIGATQATDAALGAIAQGFPAATLIRAAGTPFSEEAVTQFRAARPGVTLEL